MSSAGRALLPRPLVHDAVIYEDVPSAYVCRLSLRVLEDPVHVPGDAEGRAVERGAVRAYQQMYQRRPFSGLPLLSDGELAALPRDDSLTHLVRCFVREAQAHAAAEEATLAGGRPPKRARTAAEEGAGSASQHAPPRPPAACAAVRLVSEVRRLPDGIPASLFCRLSWAVMADPVVDPEGNTWERAAITAYVQEHRAHPLTGARMTLDALKEALTPNVSVLKAIEFWRATKTKPWRQPGGGAAAAAAPFGGASASAAAAGGEAASAGAGGPAAVAGAQHGEAEAPVAAAGPAAEPRQPAVAAASSSSGGDGGAGRPARAFCAANTPPGAAGEASAAAQSSRRPGPGGGCAAAAWPGPGPGAVAAAAAAPGGAGVGQAVPAGAAGAGPGTRSPIHIATWAELDAAFERLRNEGAAGAVIDLGGHILASPPPLAAGARPLLRIASPGAVLRNGTLRLEAGWGLGIQAADVQLQDLVVEGRRAHQATTTPGMAAAAEAATAALNAGGKHMLIEVTGPNWSARLERCRVAAQRQETGAGAAGGSSGSSSGHVAKVWGHACVAVQGGARVTLVDCQLSGAEHGLLSAGEGSVATASRCTAAECAGGFTAHSSGRMTVEGGCRATGNVLIGFLVSGGQTVMSVADGCTSERNGGGFRVQDGGKMDIGSGCIAKGSTRSSGFCSYGHNSLLITGSACRSEGSHGSGFIAEMGGEVRAGPDCVATSNKHHGFEADGVGSRLQAAARCDAEGNSGSGFFARGGGTLHRVQL